MIKVKTLHQTKITLSRLMSQYDISENNIIQFINYLDNTLTATNIIINDSNIINYINNNTIKKLRELYSNHDLFYNLVIIYRDQMKD